MNVSHDQDVRAEEAVVRLLRAARANDAAALPTRHTRRTDACVPVSRALAVAKHGARLTAAEQGHFNGCAFCQGVFRAFYGGGRPALDEETTVVSSAEETTHFDTKPRPKPPAG